MATEDAKHRVFWLLAKHLPEPRRKYLTPAGQRLPRELDEAPLRPLRIKPIDPLEGSHEDRRPTQIWSGDLSAGVMGGS